MEKTDHVKTINKSSSRRSNPNFIFLLDILFVISGDFSGHKGISGVISGNIIFKKPQKWLFSKVAFFEKKPLFPQLIAGPIVRHDELIPQFKKRPLVNRGLELPARGLALFVLGLFKKVFFFDLPCAFDALDDFDDFNKCKRHWNKTVAGYIYTEKIRNVKEYLHHIIMNGQLEENLNCLQVFKIFPLPYQS